MKFVCPQCGNRQEVVRDSGRLRCFCCRKMIAGEFGIEGTAITMLLQSFRELKDCIKAEIRLLMLE